MLLVIVIVIIIIIIIAGEAGAVSGLSIPLDVFANRLNKEYGYYCPVNLVSRNQLFICKPLEGTHLTFAAEYKVK